MTKFIFLVTNVKVGQNTIRMTKCPKTSEQEAQAQNVSSLIDAWSNEVNEFDSSAIESFRYIVQVHEIKIVLLP